MKNKIQNNRFIKILLMLVKAIISFFIVLVVSIIFVQRISNNKVSFCGYSMYTIITESMVPKYNVYDMVIVKDVEPSELVVGDDVVYMGAVSDFKDKIVTHQIISITKKDGRFHFRTKGINNDIEDPSIDESQVMGKVIFKSSLLSLISKIVNNPYGFYFVIFVPFAILLVMEFIDFIESRREK